MGTKNGDLPVQHPGINGNILRIINTSEIPVYSLGRSGVYEKKYSFQLHSTQNTKRMLWNGLRAKGTSVKACSSVRSTFGFGQQVKVLLSMDKSS